MFIEEYGGWIFYRGVKTDILDDSKCGKWMYFFNNRNFAAQICREAVEQDICIDAKHTDDDDGVCCFYLNIDDTERHKKVLKYFLDKNLIKRTVNGKLYNISFKLDIQTLACEYGKDFHPLLRLDSFVNLDTGEFFT